MEGALSGSLEEGGTTKPTDGRGSGGGGAGHRHGTASRGGNKEGVANSEEWERTRNLPVNSRTVEG